MQGEEARSIAEFAVEGAFRGAGLLLQEWVLV